MTNHVLKQLQSRLTSIIRGKDEAARLAVVALLGQGNLLIEDVPGVGKTTLAYALARSVDCSFHRIQFTSDMLPSDIIGVSVFNPESREFEFRPGPLFANILLADEINRTSPKTQSALLEAMNERRVTVERRTFRLPEPFMVIATQNPVEHQGTFPLPESQLDRFMLHISIGYPDAAMERLAITQPASYDLLEEMEPVVGRQDVLRMQEEAGLVFVEDSVLDYLLAIVGATRRHDRIRLGVSTRGAQFFLKAAKALAYYEGRGFVVPDDIRYLAPLVLGHRVMLKSAGLAGDAAAVISGILEDIPVPV